MRVRIRRIAKWGCLSLGSVMLVAAVVGYWRDLAFMAYVNSRIAPRTFFLCLGTRGFEAARLPWNQPWGLLYYASAVPTTERPAFVPRWSSHWDAPTLAIPMSNLALVTLVPGVFLWRLDRRRASHECPECRYDLRGLAEGAVCPECGAAAPPAREHAT